MKRWGPTDDKFSHVSPNQVIGGLVHDGDADAPLYALVEEVQSATREVRPVVYSSSHILAIWRWERKANSVEFLLTSVIKAPNLATKIKDQFLTLPMKINVLKVWKIVRDLS